MGIIIARISISACDHPGEKHDSGIADPKPKLALRRCHARPLPSQRLTLPATIRLKCIDPKSGAEVKIDFFRSLSLCSIWGRWAKRSFTGRMPWTEKRSDAIMQNITVQGGRGWLIMADCHLEKTRR